MQVTGTNTIPEQTPTATAVWTPTGASKATYSPAVGTLMALALNGTTRYLYNIPSPDNATATAYVRIINTSAIDGRIRGTLTENDGTATSVTLISTLPAGTTQVLSSAQLGTLFGLTTWTGRARLTINGEVPTMQVQGTVNVNTNGNQFSTNFSSVAP